MPPERGMPTTLSWGCQVSREVHTIETGWFLQRLFSTFPDGWPGFGLLLLRLSAGIALVGFAVSGFLAPGEPVSIGRDLLAAIAGVFLATGLWTPVMGALIAMDESWIALTAYSSQRDGPWIHLLLAVLTAGVAMLGPWRLVHRCTSLR